MTFSPVDLALVLVVGLGLPLFGVWETRHLKARRHAGTMHAGVRAYVLILVVEWTLTLAVAAWWYLAGRDFSAMGLGLAMDGWRWWTGAALALIACVLLTVQSIVVLRDPEKIETVRTEHGSADGMELIPRSEREYRWWPAVSITAAVCEEFVYRGFLIAIFSSVFNVAIALALSTVIFGLGHVYQGPKGVVKTGAVGLILGGLYILTGSLWAPILVHFAIDLNAGWLMRRVMATPAAQPST